MKQAGSVGKIALGTTLGNALTSTTQKLAELASGATTVGLNFETAMSQVAATMGITTEQIKAGDASFEMLSAKAKEMGASTKYTASQAAEGLNILAMAGLSAEEACEGIDTVLSLAAAGAMDLNQAATYVTGTVKAFGDSMDNASYYADLMAKGATMANTDVRSLGEAMTGVGATAASYGQTADGLALSLLKLAEQNVTGAEAATAMNRAMMDLYTPTSKAAEELERLGVSVYTDKGEARDFNVVVDELKEAFAQMSDEEANVSKNIVFSTFGLQAFNKMTVTSTEKVNSFKEGLKEASGSAMQQMMTQTDNLEGKLAILNSACEGLGLTVYEVFNDTMKDGVDSATSAVDRLNKSIKTGDLGKSLERLADAVGNFAESAIDAGEDALPMIIDGMTWLLDNADIVASGLAGIAASSFTMGTVVPIIQAANASWVAYSTATEGATVAQWLLNTAMSANPAGILITAVVGLTTALGVYLAMNNDITDRMDDSTRAIYEHAEAMEASHQAVVDNMEARKKEAESMEDEAESVQKLVKELEELSSKENKNSNDKAKIQAIVQKLNSSLKDLNLQYDAEKDALNMSNTELEKRVDLMLQEAKMNAAKEDLENIAKEQYQREKELNELLEEREELYNKYTAAKKEYLDAGYGETGIEFERTDEGMGMFVTLQNLGDQIKTTRQDISDLGDEYQETYDYIDGNTAAYEEAAGEVDKLGESAEGTGDSFDEMQAEMQEAMAEMQQGLSDTIEKQIDIFEKFEKKTGVTKDTVLSNMKSQVEGIQEWADNITQLAEKGIDQGLLAKLEAMGPQGAAYVEAFLSMSEEELSKASSLYQESLTIPAETSAQLMQAYQDAGKATGDAYKKGTEEATPVATDAAKKQGEEVIKQTKETLGTDDSNSEFEQAGEKTSEQIGEGIEKAQPELQGIINNASDTIIDTFTTNLDPSKFEGIGAGIITGIANGINNNAGSLQSATNNAVGSIVVGGEEGGESAQSSFNSSIRSTLQSVYADVSQQTATQQPVVIENHLYMEGEAAGVFNLVRQETRQMVETTGYNPLVNI